MQVILLADVPKLGAVGELVNVKPGYARNFLIPRNMAAVTSRATVRELDHQRHIAARRKTRIEDEARGIAAKLEGIAISVDLKAGESGKLFGSVSNRDVQALLAEQGIEVDRRRIEVPGQHIKELGVYQIVVRITADIHSEFTLTVAPDAESKAAIEAAEADREEATRTAEKRDLQFDIEEEEARIRRLEEGGDDEE